MRLAPIIGAMRSAIFVLALGLAYAAQAQQPPAAVESPAPVYSVVEPKVPPKAKPRAKAKSKAKAKTAPSLGSPVVQARLEPELKANGPCVIKPVMTDQDLVNCGATPPRY